MARRQRYARWYPIQDVFARSRNRFAFWRFPQEAILHQRLEWLRDWSKKAQRQVEESQSLSRLHSSSFIAPKTAATMRPRAPSTPFARGSRRALPSGPNRGRSRLAATAPFNVAMSTG